MLGGGTDYPDATAAADGERVRSKWTGSLGLGLHAHPSESRVAETSDARSFDRIQFAVARLVPQYVGLRRLEGTIT
jgi:hypothetical protein